MPRCKVVRTFITINMVAADVLEESIITRITQPRCLVEFFPRYTQLFSTNQKHTNIAPTVWSGFLQYANLYRNFNNDEAFLK